MRKLIIILSLFYMSCEDNGVEPNCEDVCGVCDGDNSTCSGCTNMYADNFESEALVDDGSCLFTYDGVDEQTGIRTIINAACTSCHPQDGGLNLSTYFHIMKTAGNSGISVIANEPSNSNLYIRINDDMPKDASPLSPNQKNAIRDWINQGANE